MNLPSRLLPILAGIGLFGAALTVLEPAALAAEEAKIIPAPKLKAAESGKQAVAIFAGGCFWGVEGVFSHIKGVNSAVSGYHGGGKANATYDEVSSGSTRHAEAVRVVYDPAQVSYGQLLQVFFSVVADPTTLNRQGPDSGTQYRTALVPVSKSQSQVARAYIAELDKSGAWKRKIVTAVEPYKAFYPAETYHQDFMFKNPAHPYIVRWDAVKVSNLKRTFPALFIAKPVRG
ncbi:MAG: peptide-methionine (S)-S-oxide reductase [Sphingomonadales bacterium RIFCSPHIGHO2_01_FULL_65_20]|jgi:peptide-methionine (S)-S-oxide reductase|uniref:peptide-methionine (S)-S-oxide reductase MsrA n=1 Tax=unclassified Blastomonas TaxID=2626550 RepID=UPI000835478A|nr:peptide-methionine (S)-S-oxide reductase MsrA [Blastomonas sp.]MCH2239734.1 peptide-methionine (S)-S-oxide reductase MsrA [Blastomonas sp.]OHC96238.1 MAG: peptide-methionine (S)-S-oxide reductase [Sphingomonadales bacterium RIFCSPHIGHO2_01_FULL_65_20]